MKINKERLQKDAYEKYHDLSKEKKNKKWKYGCKRCKNLPQDKKRMLVECIKKYEIWKEKKKFINNWWLIFFGW